MTNHEQRIALAKACGITGIRRSKAWEIWDDLPAVRWVGLWGGAVIELPDYLNDLNAVHEAEAGLLGDCEIKWGDYQRALWADIEPHRHALHATAAQRTKALLIALGIWRQEAAALTPPPDSASPAR